MFSLANWMQSLPFSNHDLQKTASFRYQPYSHLFTWLGYGLCLTLCFHPVLLTQKLQENSSMICALWLWAKNSFWEILCFKNASWVLFRQFNDRALWCLTAGERKPAKTVNYMHMFKVDHISWVKHGYVLDQHSISFITMDPPRQFLYTD